MRDSLGMADRERLVLLAVASDVRGDMEDDFEVMCFGEPPSAAVCIDEVDDPWHASWNVTFRDAFFFSRDEDGKFQLRCVYNMNDYLGESEGIIQSLLGNEAEIDPEVVVVEEELPPPVETNGDDDEDCASCPQDCVDVHSATSSSSKLLPSVGVLLLLLLTAGFGVGEL